MSDLASDAGLEEHEANHGVGAVLALLQSRLNPEAYEHVKKAIPDSDDMVSAFQEKVGAEGGGFIEAVKGMAGKILARQPGDTPQNPLAGIGLSPDQLQNFLPRLHDMLAEKIPPHVLDEIKTHIPQFGPAVQHADQD
jgi:hypothetical protein